jgi:hypothetical protein
MFEDRGSPAVSGWGHPFPGALEKNINSLAPLGKLLRPFTQPWADESPWGTKEGTGLILLGGKVM